MNKKTFDIIPPQEERAIEEKSQLLRPRKLRIRKKNKLFFFSIFLGIVLIFSLAYFFIEPKAEIDLWPKMTEVNFETQTSIAGTELVAEETASQEFLATGSTEEKQKAQGVITIYNNYHLEQILVKNTRFWCFLDNDELREFKTRERVVIPSGGHLEVEVIASEPGEEYNIPPCTFSVPGLKGSPRYTAVYGKSTSPMTGGKIAKVPMVTEDDLSLAKAILSQKAFEKSKKSLEDLISSGGYISAEGGTIQKIIEENSTARPGDSLEKFTYTVKAQTKSLALRKSNLESFAKEYVLSHISPGKEVQESSLKLEYSSPQADLETGKISLDLKIKANIYSAIDKASLKDQVKGKKLKEIQQILRDFPEIDRAKVRLWPFWVTRAPADENRIDIRLII